MKSYEWWLKQKRRVQKKYHLVCGNYMSPKDLKMWYKNYLKEKNKEEHWQALRKE